MAISAIVVLAYPGQAHAHWVNEITRALCDENGSTHVKMGSGEIEYSVQYRLHHTVRLDSQSRGAHESRSLSLDLLPRLAPTSNEGLRQTARDRLGDWVENKARVRIVVAIRIR